MKISIELDTQHDDKILISQVLTILAQDQFKLEHSQHECNCHHQDTPSVKKEEPAPVSPEPEKPKKGQIPETFKCVVCDTEYKHGSDGLKSHKFCSKKCRNKYYNDKHTEKRRIARFEVQHKGIKIIPASQVQPIQVAKDPIPVSKPIVAPEEHHEKKCPLCELGFHPDDPSQKFCNRCLSSFGEEECKGLLQDKIAEEMAKKQKIHSKWRTCPKCAKDFEALHDEMFCPRCTAMLTNKKRKK
jgi:hypothetical protein